MVKNVVLGHLWSYECHLVLKLDRNYEFPYGKFLFLRDNDLPPFSFKLLFSG